MFIMEYQNMEIKKSYIYKALYKHAGQIEVLDDEKFK